MFFQYLHIYKRNLTNISTNFAENAFEFSLFHTFEQE